jgi:hypothetical protein
MQNDLWLEQTLLGIPALLRDLESQANGAYDLFIQRHIALRALHPVPWVEVVVIRHSVGIEREARLGDGALKLAGNA